MQNLVSTPIIFPYVQPVDWNAWWELWYRENRIVNKVEKNHNQYGVLWRGFDIYVKPGIDSIKETHYKAINLNCPELFPCIFENIDQLPIDVDIVRAVSSFGRVLPHRDQESTAVSVRSMLYDNNVRDTFYYNINNNIQYQKLPDDSNTWAYWDNKVTHGTDWYMGHSKILIMYFGKTKQLESDLILKKSQSHYTEYVIYDESLPS
jgi:hypothetical protein